MEPTYALLLSLLLGIGGVALVLRLNAWWRWRQVVDGPGDRVERLELAQHLAAGASVCKFLGTELSRSLLAEPYPRDDVERKARWWYLRRRIALELTQRDGTLDGALLRGFYGLPEPGSEEAPDDLAQIRHAVLSYMMGPALEIFPFDRVPVQPPMPLSLFLLCRDGEEPHPVAYPGPWNWMLAKEFAELQNPNIRLGEHLVMEPVKMAKSGSSARVRFRWGTPPGVYLQDIEARKVDGCWVVFAIRDTFVLR